MPTDEELRRIFRRLREQGELDYLTELLREEMRHVEKAILVKLRTVLFTEPKELAELHALQGRLSAFAHLLTVYRTLADPKATKPPLPSDSLVG